MPRFVSLVNAAEGDFTTYVESTSLPDPLSPTDADSLHSYIQSFKTELYDWAEADGSEGYVQPEGAHSEDALPVTDSLRSNGWTIRLRAILAPGFEALEVMGFAATPAPNKRQLYTWIYLMLDPAYREEPWVIVDSTMRVLNWREETPVLDGIYELRCRDQLMTIKYNRAPTLFPPPPVFARSTSGSSSLAVSRSNRSYMPKGDIRARDPCCFISGGSLTESLSGQAKVAHILPHSQPWLADRLRTVLDPQEGWPMVPSDQWRKRAPNHPANLMMLISTVETAFDNLQAGVYVLESAHPKLFAFGRDGNGPPADYNIFPRRPNYEIPRMPLRSTRTPGPSATFLLLHFTSLLADICRLRMSDEPEDNIWSYTDTDEYEDVPELPRSAPVFSRQMIRQWLSDLPEDMELSMHSPPTPNSVEGQGTASDEACDFDDGSDSH